MSLNSKIFNNPVPRTSAMHPGLWAYLKTPWLLGKITLAVFLWAAATVLYGQAVQVSGTVKDAAGSPLPGVNVMVKGTTSGTTTDTEGAYKISAPSSSSVLTFSFIGFGTQEIAVGGKTVIDVSMAEDKTQLDEVVVTALGIERAAKSLTYSAQVIKGNSLNEAKETNVINSLQGKIAGVSITKSATGPGGSTKVVLRGNRSITGGNQPLYVIDGVPMNSGNRASGGGSFGGRDGGGGISMINPDNIESMTVLKGASAAALYGSAGQNGAIIITTKSGKSGRLNVDYNGGMVFDNAIALPEYQSEYGQGYSEVYDAHSEKSYGPKADGHEVTLWNGAKAPYTAHPDNVKNFLRTATTINNSISASGGNEKMRTMFSYGNVTAQGIVRNNDMRRHNIDLKIDNNLSKKLSFTTKVSYIYQEIDNMPHTGEQGYAISSIFRSPVTIPLDQMKKFNYFLPDGTEMQNYWKPGSSIQSNPYWNLNREIFFEKKDRVLGLFQAKYEFASWINLMVRGSIDKTMEKFENKIYFDTYTTYGLGSNYIVGDYMRQSTNLDALLTINRNLSEDFNLNVNLGGAIQSGVSTSMYADSRGLNKQNFFYLVNAKAAQISNGSFKSPLVQSVYGTATLAYKDYLFADVTARNDWSSALPMGEWSYFYPSFGLNAVLSDAFKMPEWVSYGKVRASLAYAGSGGGAFLDRNYYMVAAGGAIGTQATKALPTYKPELTTSFEVGAEWRFFNNRFGVDVTYYNSDTKNQLIVIATPAASLFSSQYINAGLINNKGVEAMLTVTPVQTERFSWDASLNYAKNVNHIIRLTDDVREVILLDDRAVYLNVKEGDRYGEMYGKGWERDAQGRPLVDKDGMPLLTQNKTVRLGNFNPNYNLGFNNTFNYGPLSLGILLDYRNGGTVVAGTQALLDADGHSKASLWGRENGIVLDAYTATGEKNTKSITSQAYFGKIGERYPSAEFYSFSATNLRIRELVFSYNLSKFVGENKFIKDARIALVGRNLAFLIKKAPFDPELVTGTGNFGGIEYNALPSTRSLGFNIKLSF